MSWMRACRCLMAALVVAPLAAPAQEPEITYHEGRVPVQEPCCEREMRFPVSDEVGGESWVEMFHPLSEEAAHVDPGEPLDLELEADGPCLLLFRFLAYGEEADHGSAALLTDTGEEAVERFESTLLREGLSVIYGRREITAEFLEHFGSRLVLRFDNGGEDRVYVEALAGLTVGVPDV